MGGLHNIYTMYNTTQTQGSEVLFTTYTLHIAKQYSTLCICVCTKSIEPTPPLAKLRVRNSQFREPFFSVIYNKKIVVCYYFALIGTSASEAEAHY